MVVPEERTSENKVTHEPTEHPTVAELDAALCGGCKRLGITAREGIACEITMGDVEESKKRNRCVNCTEELSAGGRKTIDVESEYKKLTQKIPSDLHAELWNELHNLNRRLEQMGSEPKHSLVAPVGSFRLKWYPDGKVEIMTQKEYWEEG